jgi:hypothetical protein
MSHIVVQGLAVAVVLTASALAQAQEAEQALPPAAEQASPAGAAATTPAPAAAAPTTAAPTPSPAPAADAGGDATKPRVDGARFRFGVAAGIGFFTASLKASPAEASFTYYGGDLRLGAQINDLLGVYVQPTLGYYTADVPNVLAIGGLLGVAVVADVTIIDRFFAGAGIGYTIYNAPGGMTPILRIGGYPLMSRNDQLARRKGLMLGADLRFTSLEQFKTIVMPTFNVGYEAF